jgi:Na+/melibiose symporter-like transporter
MVRNVPNTGREKIVSQKKDVQRAQQIRLRRFGMAVATYLVVIVAAFLVTRLGLGDMTAAQWVIYIGLGLIGNVVFFFLFYTNVNLRFSDASLTWEQIVYSALWGMVPLYALPEARPVVLMFYLPAFSFGMLRLTRPQYLSAAACVMALYASVLGLEYFQGRQGFRLQYELFLFVLFGILVTWFAFFGGFVSDMRRRLRLRNEEILEAHERIQRDIAARKQAEEERELLIRELQEALAKVKMLSGMLPICSSCKRIRDDQGYWQRIEEYIRDHSEAEFTHSVCQDCARKLYPELYEEDS